MKRRDSVLWGMGMSGGLAVACFDSLVDPGDESPALTLLLLIAGAAALGFAEPKRAWRWALAVGPWLAAVHLLVRSLGRSDYFQPDSIPARLVLLPVGLVTALIGSYLGALTRRSVSGHGHQNQ